MKQSDDCKVFGYTWVECPDDSVRILDKFSPVKYGYALPTQYKVVPKEGSIWLIGRED